MSSEASPAGNIHERLIDAMSKVGAIGKNKKVSGQGMNYSFRGIDDLMNATHPVFIECGITVVPEVIDVRQSFREVTNDYGRVTEWERVMLTVRYTFSEPGGTSVCATVVGSGLDNSDKASNKALSGAFKYALMQVLNIPTEDMEDGDSTRPSVESDAPKNVAPKGSQEPTARGGHMAEAARQMGLKQRLNGDPWADLQAQMKEHRLSSNDVKAVLGTFNRDALVDWLAIDEEKSVAALVADVLSKKQST